MSRMIRDGKLQMDQKRSLIVAPTLTRPANGVGRNRVYLLTFNAQGVLDEADRNEVAVMADDGGLSAPTMTRQSQGLWFADYLLPSASDHSSVQFQFSWSAGGVAMSDSAMAAIN